MADELIAGRYRLLEPLGRGAMSAVWLAEDEELGRRVAVKTLAPTADRQRFEREARAAAALSHPNICSLYDYGEAERRPYMVLEYLPGGSLEDRLTGGPLPDDETQRIATEIAAGLAHAHARGLVHRDLKPANILFDVEERAKIADFGIARMGGTGTLTEAGTVLGTASYISPEQAAGQPAGPASDVYSFGVILFRMLTGRLPFVSANAMELVRMHRDDPPPEVHDFRADAPARLEAVAAAALAKDPAARPADGEALLAELRGDETAATMVAVAPADATQVMRPAATAAPPWWRRPLPIAALTAVLLLGGAALALALTGGNGGGAPASTPSLSLPSVSTGSTQPTTTEAQTTTPTTAPSTTEATTTTTAHTTSTTAPTTTAPAVTSSPVTTVVPPTTTLPPLPTTVPATTDVTTDTTAPTTTITLP